MGGKYAGQGTFEGRNFDKSGGKPVFPGQKGNKGIPPEGVPGNGSKNQKGQVAFPGHVGDKGVGCGNVKGSYGAKAPRD